MRISFMSVVLLTAVATGSLFAQEKKPFDRMDVFALEWVNDPQISPDGSTIVYGRGYMDLMKDRRQSRLWIINNDGTNHQKLTSSDLNESSATWSPDGSRLAYTSSSENGSEIYVFWLNSGKSARLTQLERSPRGLSWSPDGRHIAFSMLVPEVEPWLAKAPPRPKGADWAPAPRVTTRLAHERDGSGYIEPGYSQLFVIPSEGGSARQITSGNFHHRSTPQWTRDGSTLVFSANRNEDWEYDYRESEIYSVSVQSGEIKSLTTRNGPDGNPMISPDGSRIAYLGFDDKVQTYQITRLYTMNLDGTGKKEIDLKLDRSISDIHWDASSSGIYFQYDDKGNSRIGFTTLSGKVSEISKDLGGTAVGRPYGGGSFSISKAGLIAFNHTDPYHPAELAIVKRGESTRIITSLNADVLPHRNLAKVEEVWYKSTVDRRDIQGWIVYPPGYDSSKQYPLIVENHGGPISNYGDRFSPEIQLYASAGFMVFYPNPRGSTGYGEEFGNQLFNNYPGDDYQDVMDGVDQMISMGIVSEDSLFVTGGSAGGIMSAWIIGKNNRFRAAAVVKPVMNWISKTLVADNYYGYANYRYPGQPWENFENYWKFSPLSLVGNIQTPTLVMVGTADLRTPLSESKQLYHALKLRKIETALVEIPGSYHFISNRPSQLITKVDHVVAWFNKYR